MALPNSANLCVRNLCWSSQVFQLRNAYLSRRYGSVHLRGTRSLSGTSSGRTGKGKSWNHGGKGKSTWRSSFVAYDAGPDEFHEGHLDPEDHGAVEEDFDSGHVGLLGDAFPGGEENEDAMDKIECEEWEATALNAMAEFDFDDQGLDLAGVGEVIQLELAALAAFQRTKGKGYGSKGKGKGKGKVVPWNNAVLDLPR